MLYIIIFLGKDRFPTQDLELEMARSSTIDASLFPRLDRCMLTILRSRVKVMGRNHAWPTFNGVRDRFRAEGERQLLYKGLVESVLCFHC